MIFLLLSRVQEKIKKFTIDLFFPKKCLGCGRADIYLCPACFNKIEVLPIVHKKQKYLDKLIAACQYRNPLVKELIKNFKYNYIKELAEPLGHLLIKSLEKNWRLGILFHQTQTKNWKFIIMPIPLYGTRKRKRGFNQAELLAKEVAEHFNLPLETNILKRILPTVPQVDIKNHEKRKTNIKDAFDISPQPSVEGLAPSAVEGKTIILIDDVTTTGATLIEAAKVLKKSGANEIWGLVVAKG